MQNSADLQKNPIKKIWCKVGVWLEGAAAVKSHEKGIKCAVEQSGINME